MCPAEPMFTKELPHISAISPARSNASHGSSLLVINTEGKGRRSRGTGAKSLISLGVSGRSTSAGATSKAPFILLICADLIRQQWATAIQPRLCPTRTTEPGAAFTYSQIFVSQSSRLGVSQSRCCTRLNPWFCCSHNVCQCSGPELCQPGKVKTVIIQVSAVRTDWPVQIPRAIAECASFHEYAPAFAPGGPAPAQCSRYWCGQYRATWNTDWRQCASSPARRARR